MNILSIDIGIKNLAYCIIHIDNESKANIKEFDSIDLFPKKLCSCKLKNGKICNKIGKYTNNKDQIFCGFHSDKKKIPSSKKKGFKQFSLGELQTYVSNLNINLENKKKYTKKDYLNCITKYNLELYTEIKHLNSSKVGIIEISKQITVLFNETFKSYLFDIILIENQIGPKAIRMKQIQSLLTQYWVMKNKNMEIEYISPQNKLKQEDKKLDYTERKKKSIEICLKKLINLEINLVEKFNLLKKKDDVADAILQGFWYIENKLNK